MKNPRTLKQIEAYTEHFPDAKRISENIRLYSKLVFQKQPKIQVK